MTESAPAWALKLRVIEAEHDRLGVEPGRWRLVSAVCRDVLALQRVKTRGIVTHVPDPVSFERGKMAEGDGECVERPRWRVSRRLKKCGKPNCTKCPHGPYWYVRVTLPSGAVHDVSLGRAPVARHVFDRLGGLLDGDQIPGVVDKIREGGQDGQEAAV